MKRNFWDGLIPGTIAVSSTGVGVLVQHINQLLTTATLLIGLISGIWGLRNMIRSSQKRRDNDPPQ